MTCVATPTIFDGCPVLFYCEPVHLYDKILWKGLKVTSPGREKGWGMREGGEEGKEERKGRRRGDGG